MTDAKDATAAPMTGADKAEPERSPQDQAAVDRLRERRKRKRAPRFEVTYEGDTANLTAADGDSIYEHAQLADLFDTADTAFSSGMLGQIANIARSGKQLTSRAAAYANLGARWPRAHAGRSHAPPFLLKRGYRSKAGSTGGRPRRHDRVMRRRDGVERCM